MDTLLEDTDGFSVQLRPTSHREIERDNHDHLQNLTIRHYERQEAAVADELQFFGEETDQTITRTIRISLSDLLMTQRAIKAMLPQWKIVREACYNDRKSVNTRRLAVEVAPDQFDFVLEWGRQFWCGPGGERMIIDVFADKDRECDDSEITFSLPAHRHDWLKRLLPKLREWSDSNHFYRNQAITAQGEFVKFESDAVLDDVILHPDIRLALRRNCIDLLSYAELYKANKISLRRGIVLHGPPGTGKTSIGRALAQQCNATFILCTPGMLVEPKDVRRVFKWARRFAPAILFFEDIDMVAGNRYDGGRGGVLGEFLSGLDGLDSSGGVITIATTNDLRSIESALKDRPNRFDCILEIGALKKEQRLEYLERWSLRNIAGTALSGHEFNAEKVAQKTGGFTGAQMQEICRMAVFVAVEERVQKNDTTAEMISLTDVHFEEASRRMGKKTRRTVGFVKNDED